MKFGVYVHIPYCIQKCHYCDFTTFSLDHQIKMETYTNLILAEIRHRHADIEPKNIDSIYFGGGTPSLLPVQNILAIIRELNNVGFKISPSAEISIEINPGTIDPQRLDFYQSAGINRFSLGVQTFNPLLLKAMGREHSVEQTWNDITLLTDSKLNYTVDFLFGLPHQSLKDFQSDLMAFQSFKPKHLSAYNLTVPSGHPMNKHRAEDEVQASMFDEIEAGLAQVGVNRYEISNYAAPGFEGKHNSLYWNDGEYWGLGVSAHSYLKPIGSDWGFRFWNSGSAKIYQDQCGNKSNRPFYKGFPSSQLERLQRHEALTDFCHTQLRKISGLNWAHLSSKFGDEISATVLDRFRKAQNKGLATTTSDGFTLTTSGRALANQSFLEFTFVANELPGDN